MNRICICCNSKESWLDSPYCYDCYCQLTKKNTARIYKGVNREYEYYLTERTMNVSNGTKKVGRRKKQTEG